MQRQACKPSSASPQRNILSESALQLGQLSAGGLLLIVAAEL